MAAATVAPSIPLYLLKGPVKRNPITFMNPFATNSPKRNSVLFPNSMDVGDEFEGAFAAGGVGELEGFVEGGFAGWDGERLALSEKGQFLARNMAMLFDTHLRGSEASTHRFSRTV